MNRAHRAVESRLRFFEREAANERAELWRASERRYAASGAREHRSAWADYYRARVVLFEELAEANRRKLNALIDEGGGGHS